jgi:hypothetical protein
MEAYKRQTREVLRRFLSRQMTFAKCIASLDAALAVLVQNIQPADRPQLRILMMANNELVMVEMERRAAERKAKYEN